jgi:lysozyme
MKYNRSHFLDKLIEHEGLVLTVYQDTLGIDTIGIGRNLKDRGISKEELDYLDLPNMEVIYEHGISEADARYLALNDIAIVENELCRVHPCVEELDSVRQLILMDMAFNMGVPRLCKFKKMWNAIHEENFEAASIEMMDSRWARQVGRRASKLSDAMKTGEF